MTLTHHYNLVIFDMGDILYDATAWRRWLHHYFHERGLLKIPYHVLFDIWDEKYLADIHKNILEYKTGFKQFLDYLEIPQPEQQKLLQINWEIKKKLESETKPFSDVPPTLQKIKQNGIKNAVLSDTELSAVQVNAILERFAIDCYFDYIFVSSEMGHRKPEVEAFEYCLQHAGFGKKEAVFVAHDRDELHGASAFGLTTIAFNYREPVEANYKIKSFSNILEIIL